jgi:hypothetical protein
MKPSTKLSEYLWQQCNQSGEETEIEGEREREQLINVVRNGSVGSIWKWCGLEMTIGEKDT